MPHKCMLHMHAYAYVVASYACNAKYIVVTFVHVDFHTLNGHEELHVDFIGAGKSAHARRSYGAGGRGWDELNYACQISRFFHEVCTSCEMFN